MTATIQAESLRERMSDRAPVQALDVRSAAEFATGHVPGAVNIPMEQVESRLEDLPSGPLVLICEGGKRAEIVAGWLAGRREVTLLEGGTRAWRNAGYPLVACAPCRWTLERQVRLIAGLIVLAATLLSFDQRKMALPGNASRCGDHLRRSHQHLRYGDSAGEDALELRAESQAGTAAVAGRKLLRLIAGGVTQSKYGLRGACQRAQECRVSPARSRLRKPRRCRGCADRGPAESLSQPGPAT